MTVCLHAERRTNFYITFQRLAIDGLAGIG